MKYIWIFVAAIIFIGYILPAVAISNGVNSYDGEEREYAIMALEDLEYTLSSPSLYKLYTTKHKIVSMQKTENPNCPYLADIRGYSYFGIEAQRYNVSPRCSVSH